MTEIHLTTSPCGRCAHSCCRAVKHMPYQGETHTALFSSLLIGGFPDLEESSETRHGSPYERRPFVAEWIIPAEQSACPCLDASGLCTIYEHRPVSCRQFPVDSQGNRHGFCSFASDFDAPSQDNSQFQKAADSLDTLLLMISREQGAETLNEFLFETHDTGIPMLYNSYLICLLLLAGAEVKNVLSAQLSMLESCRDMGLTQMTFIIPGTDYCITSVTAELEINLKYLMARMEERALGERLAQRLSQAGITDV